MIKINRLLAIICVISFMLIGCSSESQEYRKTTGEIISKNVVGGRFGDTYYLKVSFPVVSTSGKYIIDECNVNKSVYDNLQVKDKVTIYVNDNEIGEVVK